MKDLRLVKKIVNDYFEINISDKSRKRDYVDARRFYYTLSREIVKNATLTKIGKLVKKDHASVNFGINTLKIII
jgi:chromosomal replication initiation ATPase DnaA